MRNLLISASFHVVLVGAIWVAHRPITVCEPPIPIEPIVFESVEESHEASSAEATTEEVMPEETVPVDDARPVLVPEIAMPRMTPTAIEPPAVDLPKVTTPEVRAPIDAIAELPSAEEHAKLVTSPQAESRILPAYPRSARRNHHEGLVTVEFTIDAAGKVNAAIIVTSSGYRELDDSALSAVRQARFAPATEDGVSVSSTLRLTFEFKLK